MSEAPPEGGSGDAPPADEFTPITSQDDLNRVIGERVKRATAKYADHGDLKAKAARLAEIEAANQTEAEKAQAKITELETEMQSVRLDSLRRKVAGENEITDQDDIDLFLTGTDEETLTRQAKRLAERESDRKKRGNRVPSEGTSPSSTDGAELETVRSLFGR